ncbi:MAG: radical SAM protein [Bdellovibrionales bacterium]|nr:radical SAM protein [Bdellovibrionales bacterium]
MSQCGVWQNTLEFTCTWDLGRRCSMDCTYCPPHRHNDWSPHASLEDLKKAAELPLRYGAIFNEYASGQTHMNISFTGGEPTLNPEFLPLCRHIKEVNSHFRVGVTTNGLFSDNYAKELCMDVDFVTLSYHFEASDKAKARVNGAIQTLRACQLDQNYRMNDFGLNVMVHANADYFRECKELVELWKSQGIRVSLREIGEHPDDKGAHHYTQEQIEFMAGKPKSAGSCSEKPKSPGRPCCGNRSFKELRTTEEDSEVDTSDLNWIQSQEDGGRVIERNFKGWSCLVNLFFLHIEQEAGDVFYHQTCQANLEGGRGPIGNLKDIEPILHSFEQTLKAKKVPAITCPNKKCNCGLCITKAPNPKVLQTFLNHSFPGLELA